MRKRRTNYPRWYGIYGIEFIWHGAYSDSEIRYGKHVTDSCIVEDSMYERYKEERPECTFEEYMYINRAEVKELCLVAAGVVC